MSSTGGGGRIPALSLARTGLALTVLVAAGWLTGAPYVVVRFGIPLPGVLPRLDGAHVWVGVALAALLLAKVVDLHLRAGLARLAGRVLLWQRWLSLGLLLAYGGVLATGLLLLPSWPAPVTRNLVDLHLLTAGWAGAVTLVHAGRYLANRLPPGTVDARLLAGLVAILVPAALLLALPRAATPLTRAGGGEAWQQVGPEQFFASAIVRLPDGRLAAAGSGVALSADDGLTWRAVPALSARLVRAVAPTTAGSPVYAATDQGVLVAPAIEGPYRPAGLAQPIDSLYVEPSDPRWLWAGGIGLWQSHDGGSTWTPAVSGLVARGHIWSIRRLEGVLYAAGTTGVYAWDGASWARVSTLASVYSLDPGAGGDIWASSMGDGIEVFHDGRWRRSDAGLAGHGASQAVHVDGVTWLTSGRLVAATMDSGVAVSTDGGATWTPLAAGWRPGDVWQVAASRHGLLAATDSGLYRYPLPATPAPGSGWWLFVFVGAAAAACATAVGALTAGQVKLLGAGRALLRWFRSAAGATLHLGNQPKFHKR